MARTSFSNVGFAKAEPVDKVPLPPKDAKVYPTACDYCIVGCAYKAFVWPKGTEGGPKANENAYGVDFPRVDALAGWWATPQQYNEAYIDGKLHSIIVIPDGNATVVNRAGNHSIRGGAIAQKIYNPNKGTRDRLQTPMLRVGNYHLPVSWDTATRVAGELMRYTVNEFGENALTGKVGSYIFWENTYAWTKLMMQQFETMMVAHHDKPSWSFGADSSAMSALGINAFAPSYDDYSSSEVIFSSGTDSYEDHTVLWTEWIQQAEPTMIYVLPRTSKGVEWALGRGGIFFKIYPGTDVPLYNAISRVIIENGWYDRSWLNYHGVTRHDINAGMGRGKRNSHKQWRTTKWGLTLSEFKQFILNDEFSTLEAAEKISGVNRADIVRAAELMAKPKPDGSRTKTSFLNEKGNYWSNNWLNNAAFVNLSFLCGAGTRQGQVIGRGGGHQRGMIQGHKYLSHKSPGRYGQNTRVAGNVDRWVMSGHARYMYLTACQWTNCSCAASDLSETIMDQTVRMPQQLNSTDADHAIQVLKERMQNRGLVLVHQDVYARDVTELADIVLPAAQWGEADLTRAQGERRMRAYSKFTDPPGDAKPDWWITNKIGQYAGFGANGFNWKTNVDVLKEAARHSRKGVLEYAPLIRYTNRLGVDAFKFIQSLGSTGLQTPIRLDLGKLVGTKKLHYESAPQMRHEENTTHHKKLFNWFTFSTGKAMFFKTDWRLFADYFERVKPRGDELWVTNGRVNEMWQSLYDDLRRPYIMQRYPMNFIEIHPDDASARGIQTGDLVAVENDDLLVQTGGVFGVRDEDSLFTGLMKAGHIKRSRAALTAMAIVNTDVKKGVTYMYFLWPGSSYNSLMHDVPDPITAAPRYKTAKGRIRKIGETAAKRSGILKGLEHKNTMPEWA